MPSNGEIANELYQLSLFNGGDKNINLKFVATLKKNTWSVSLKRKLVSNKASDFNIEIGKLYSFGFAIPDDYSNSRFHHVSLGYKLGLDNDDAEINAQKQ